MPRATNAFSVNIARFVCPADCTRNSQANISFGLTWIGSEPAFRIAHVNASGWPIFAEPFNSSEASKPAFGLPHGVGADAGCDVGTEGPAS